MEEIRWGDLVPDDGSPQPAIECATEHQAWRAAKTIAQLLDLPLIDETGAGELRLNAPVSEPGPPPPSIEVAASATALKVRIPGGPWWALVLLVGVCGLVTLRLGLSAPSDLPWAWYVSAGFGVAGVIAGLLSEALGTRTLAADRHRVAIRGPFPRGTRAVPIASIERITASPAIVGTALHFVAEDRILRLRIPGNQRSPTAHWIRHRLSHWLAETG